MAYRRHHLATVDPPDAISPRGERLLALATLEDGIRTILDATHRYVPPRKLQEDLAWLTSNDPEPAFGFLSLCDFLGFDPDYLRARVLASGRETPMATPADIR